MACDKSLLSDMAAKGQDFAWMSQVVIAPRDYPLIVGEYDGYGRVLGPTGQVDEIIDLEYNGSGFSAWHRRCWERVGRPKHYKGQAPAAKDQGWFFDDEDYKGTEPGR
jgi:hypothetical protein